MTLKVTARAVLPFILILCFVSAIAFSLVGHYAQEQSMNVSAVAASRLPLPDLEALITPKSLRLGEPLRLEGVVRNVGGAATTRAFFTSFEVDLDNKNEENLIKIFKVTNVLAAPGSTSIGLNINEIVPVGQHRYRLCVDSKVGFLRGNVVKESNNNNNCSDWTVIKVENFL